MNSASKQFTYDYPRPAVSVDIAVFHAEKRGPTKLLLIKRLRDPFAEHWALPGGFLDMDETLEEAAVRELREETQVQANRLEPIGAFSRVDRDPRGRVISFGFLAVLPDAPTPEAVAGDDAKDAAWFPLDALPPLAFDHAQIVEQAVQQLRQTRPL